MQMDANGKAGRTTDERSILIHLRSFVVLLCYTLFLFPQSQCPVGKRPQNTINTYFFVCVTRFEQGFKGWTGNVIVINNIVSMGKFLDSF